ncbi:MAG: META domain-containing protein [Chromatiaceae bacterium]|nr:META domain-containing protein [Chromatiaceae bacterium]
MITLVCRTILLGATISLAACQPPVLPSGQYIQVNPAGDDKALSLNFEQDSLSGFTGCNRAMGSFTIDKGELVVSQLASTMMACSEQAMAREQVFMQFLQNKPALSIQDKVLVLRKDDTEYRFITQH